MKRSIAAGLCTIMILCAMTACGSKDNALNETQSNGNLTVETAITQSQHQQSETEKEQVSETFSETNESENETLESESGTNDTIYYNADSLKFSESEAYAVSFLGYNEMEDLTPYKNDYDLPSDINIVEVSGDEYYLVIPKSGTSSITVERMNIDSDEVEPVYEADNGKPFVVRCNVSDIFPDAKITLTTSSGGSYTFSPSISLKDGSLLMGDYGMDITRIQY